MTSPNTVLGRLVRIDLRAVWGSEASDFTPWLAREENLQILGDALGIDLELEAQEKSVGPFRADILCKNIATGSWVLVENQLERTDHGHLGQLLTYASGLDAVTIVWIAARFTEEHRSTLDWLNKITDESFRFFGLEVELWKTGDSAAAPKFNIVSKPNNWSRSVAQAARAIDESELSDIQLKQPSYWEAFNQALSRSSGPVSGARKPRPSSWMSYAIGRADFNLGVAMSRPKRQIMAFLYIKGVHAKGYFHQLQAQSPAIEAELGFHLNWEALPDGQDSRVSVAMATVDLEDERDWPRQHAWLAGTLNALHRVFVSRVRDLDADDWRREPEPDGFSEEEDASV